MKYAMACMSLAVAVVVAQTAFAQSPPAGAATMQSTRDSEFEAAVAAAQKVAKSGPVLAQLGGEGSIQLPANYLFVPQPEAGQLMRAEGNSSGPDLVGLIYPQGDGGWLATVRFISAGYIKDDDAKVWNADELLANLREGTEAANADRIARGFPALDVKGWIEKPAYDAASHRLIWSARAAEKGVASGGESVNYNTYALGRNGYFNLNFITSPEAIEAQKPIARELLAAIHYDAGKSYADFNSATDKVAEYGLAALVGGVVANKLGLFALIAAFAVKFAKIILLGCLALFGGFAKFFRRKPKSDEQA